MVKAGQASPGRPPTPRGYPGRTLADPLTDPLTTHQQKAVIGIEPSPPCGYLPRHQPGTVTEGVIAWPK